MGYPERPTELGWGQNRLCRFPTAEHTYLKKPCRHSLHSVLRSAFTKQEVQNTLKGRSTK